MLRRHRLFYRGIVFVDALGIQYGGIIFKAYRIMIGGATEVLFVCGGIIFEAYAIRPYISELFKLTQKTVECRQ